MAIAALEDSLRGSQALVRAGADLDMIRRALNHKAGSSITEQYIVDRIDLVRPVFNAVADQYKYYIQGGTGKAVYHPDGGVLDLSDPEYPYNAGS